MELRDSWSLGWRMEQGIRLFSRVSIVAVFYLNSQLACAVSQKLHMVKALDKLATLIEHQLPKSVPARKGVCK